MKRKEASFGNISKDWNFSICTNFATFSYFKVASGISISDSNMLLVVLCTVRSSTGERCIISKITSTVLILTHQSHIRVSPSDIPSLSWPAQSNFPLKFLLSKERLDTAT